MWDLGDILPHVAAADIWPDLTGRHDALVPLVSPPIFESSMPMTVAALDDEDLLVWRARGNLDEALVVVQVRARAASGSVELSLRTDEGGTGDAVLVDTAGLRPYHLTAPPGSAGLCECVLSADGAGTIEIVSVASFLLTVPAALRTATASGAIAAPDASAGRPVASEYVSRALALPGQLARDRPNCVFSHGGRATGTLTPTYGQADPTLWGAVGDADAPSSTLVGRGLVPELSQTGRRLIVDVFFARDAGGRGELRLAGLPPMLIDDDGWVSAVIEGPGAGGELAATVHLDSTDEARFQTVQVWRAQGEL